ASIGTRVGFTFRFRALVPLNLLRVQNLMAASPSGNPSAVTARLACIRMPHTVWSRGRQPLSFLPHDLYRMPIVSRRPPLPLGKVETGGEEFAERLEIGSGSRALPPQKARQLTLPFLSDEPMADSDRCQRIAHRLIEFRPL